jgi:hypothetical protein
MEILVQFDDIFRAWARIIFGEDFLLVYFLHEELVLQLLNLNIDDCRELPYFVAEKEVAIGKGSVFLCKLIVLSNQFWDLGDKVLVGYWLVALGW